MIYLLDTNIFVETKKRFAPINVGISFWAMINQLAVKGIIASVDNADEFRRYLGDKAYYEYFHSMERVISAYSKKEKLTTEIYFETPGYFYIICEDMDYNPVQAHLKDEPMEQGEIYEVEIEMFPHSRLWHKGEELRLEITGEFVKTDWYEDGHLDFETDNGNGKHVIHTGGKYASYLQIPVIPPKYVSGDFVVR